MRKQAREVVFKVLFAKLFNNDDNDMFGELISEYALNDSDACFAKRLLKTVQSNMDKLNQIISDLSVNYKLERIYPTDRCALFIGLSEMTFFPDVPNIVAIDEALSLSRIYSTENSLSFVNGIFAEYKKILENKGNE